MHEHAHETDKAPQYKPSIRNAVLAAIAAFIVAAMGYAYWINSF